MSAVEGIEKTGWSLDRRVPMMLLVMLGVQIGGALLWAGSVGERIGALEITATSQSDMAERLVRQEEKLRHVLEALVRIEVKLERMEGARKGRLAML